jgi:hypothetical protein
MPKITVSNNNGEESAQILSLLCSITTIRDMDAPYICFIIFLAQFLLGNNGLLIPKLLHKWLNPVKR